MPIEDFKKKIDSILNNLNIESDVNLVEYLIRVNTRLEIILKIIRSGFYGNFQTKKEHRINLLLQIFSYRILKNSDLNIIQPELFTSNNNKDNDLHIIGPVCPDYSYVNTKDGRYRYTFESIGNGIGLVAKKAIINFSILDRLSKDLVANGLNLKFKILIGDFEANEKNLEALNESKSSFLKKVSLSRDTIEQTTGIKTDLFTSLSLGLEGWQTQIEQIKLMYNLKEFIDLERLFPDIKHEKRLISRLPLYKKWFGNSANFKQIFLNQTLEYILMGSLISNSYQNRACILASDHKAMREYYSLISKIVLISSSFKY